MPDAARSGFASRKAYLHSVITLKLPIQMQSLVPTQIEINKDLVIGKKNR